MSKKKRSVPRRSANEARYPDHALLKPCRPTREQLEDQIRMLSSQLSHRTPVEEAAQNVDILRNGVTETRDRISRLENELQEERSRLATTMLAHSEAVSKFKEMTALAHQVP